MLRYEELQEKMEGYNNLTERINAQQDETMELESQLEKLRQEVDNTIRCDDTIQ